MNSRNLGADAVFSWPGAEVAVMGAEGAVDVLHRRAIEADPSSRPDLVADYRTQALRPDLPCEILSVDEILQPEQTRDTLIRTLSALRGATQPGFRHDNLPQ